MVPFTDRHPIGPVHAVAAYQWSDRPISHVVHLAVPTITLDRPVQLRSDHTSSAGGLVGGVARAAQPVSASRKRAYRMEFPAQEGLAMTVRRHSGPMPSPTTSGLEAVARERAVMSTVADAIVAAATGKGLRVAVGCADPAETVFADQLTRALVARGRACRCVSAKRPPTTDHTMSTDHTVSTDQAGRTVAVITSGLAESGDTDLCRIDIEVNIDPSDAVAEDGYQPDIVVDYRHPDGPMIRYVRAVIQSAFENRIAAGQPAGEPAGKI